MGLCVVVVVVVVVLEVVGRLVVVVVVVVVGRGGGRDVIGAKVVVAVLALFADSVDKVLTYLVTNI